MNKARLKTPRKRAVAPAKRKPSLEQSKKPPPRKDTRVIVAREREQIRIGPIKLTRFERARIIGARSLQLALGAPPFVATGPNIRDPITLALAELDSKLLPISIRRTLPDGSYQDIPIQDLV